MRRVHSPSIDELIWLETILGTGVAEPKDYLCQPNVQHPQLFVPLQPRAATAGAMRRLHDDRSWPQRVAVALAQTLAHLGVLSAWKPKHYPLPSYWIMEELARRFGETELIAAFSLGPPRRNRKPIVQLMTPAGRTIGFAKIGWSPFTTELIANEARWLRHVEGRMPAPLRSPHVLLDEEFFPPYNGTTPEDPIRVVITSPAPARWWQRRSHPIGPDTLIALAHLGTDDAAAVSDLTLLKQWDDTELSSTVDLDLLRSRHDGVTLHTGLWHGDLTPWNMATVSGVTTVWDWEFAGDHRPIGFDALHRAFEAVRRSGRDAEAKAIAHIESHGASILGLNDDNAEAAATVDLYLCELLHREQQLAGEGWEPNHLGPLDHHLISALQRRLQR